jgi:hypothetical protein
VKSANNVRRVRLSAYIGAAPAVRISVKFANWGLVRKSGEKIQIWLKCKKYRTFYMKSQVHFIVAGDIKSP